MIIIVWAEKIYFLKCSHFCMVNHPEYKNHEQNKNPSPNLSSIRVKYPSLKAANLYKTLEKSKLISISSETCGAKGLQGLLR